MPNKKRSAKLRDKILLSGANFKDENVKSTLKELIKKSRIEEDDNEEDLAPVEIESEKNLDNDEKEVEVQAKKKKKAKNGENGNNNISKKNKKNKYFLLAHPEMKEKIKSDNHQFVINKEIVKKKFLVEKPQSNGKNKTHVQSAGDDEIASLWRIEPCTDDEEEKEDKKSKKKKRKLNPIEDLKFETKKEVLEDGTVVETYSAVEEKDESEEDESQKDVKKKKKKDKIENNENAKTKPQAEKSEAEIKLQSSRFRYLNELLYTKKSDESYGYFKKLVNSKI